MIAVPVTDRRWRPAWGTHGALDEPIDYAPTAPDVTDHDYEGPIVEAIRADMRRRNERPRTHPETA